MEDDDKAEVEDDAEDDEDEEDDSDSGAADTTQPNSRTSMSRNVASMVSGLEWHVVCVGTMRICKKEDKHFWKTRQKQFASEKDRNLPY